MFFVGMFIFVFGLLGVWVVFWMMLKLKFICFFGMGWDKGKSFVFVLCYMIRDYYIFFGVICMIIE